MAVLHLVKSPCGSYSYRHTIGVLLLCPEWNIFANCATKWGGWIFHKLLCDWGWHSRWIQILQLQRFYSLVTKMPHRNSWKVIDLFHQHGVDRSRPDNCHRDVGPFHTPPRRHFVFLSLQWAAVWHFAPPAPSLDPIWTWKALIHQSTAGTRFNPHFCRGAEHPPVSKGSAVDSDSTIADIKLKNHIIGIFTRSGCKQNKIHVAWLDYIIYLASVGYWCIVQNLSCRLDSDLFAFLE